MKYMIVAGEASGDLHASGLIAALRSIDGEASFRFFGGDMMAKAADQTPDLHYRELNVMGFSEVVRRIPTVIRSLNRAKRLLNQYRPDMLVLVDFPSFNLKLAAYANKLGIKTSYFISPKVWAWKEFRVKSIRRYVDNLYCILPFEPEFFRKRDYSKAIYVGNPSVKEMDEALARIPQRKYFFDRQGIIDTGQPVIALLPGSRRGEIRNNLPLMIEAAKRFPEYRYIIAAAPAIPEKYYREIAQDPGLTLAFGATTTLLKYADAALVTSGTATLETALVGTPQVVCYRANGRKLSYKIMEKLLKVKYVALPNLIVGKEIVPELLVHLCTTDSIARNLAPLLQPSPQRDCQLGGYKTMRRKLGSQVAAEQVAKLIYDCCIAQKS